MTPFDKDRLNARRISRLCGKNIPVPEVFGTVGSTNDIAKERALAGAPPLLCIAADSQSAGRGRNGHSFHSPAGTGLYMSVILRPDADPEYFSLITPAAAVYLCEACEELFGISPEIKWVNDLFSDGKKICGILTEASLGGAEKQSVAIIGVGVNTYEPEGGFPAEISNTAGSLLDAPKKDARNSLCAAFLSRLSELQDKLTDPAFRAEIAEKYRRRCFVIGKKINIISASGTQKATVLNTDDQCRLEVRLDSGEKKTLCSGEISIRLDEK